MDRRTGFGYGCFLLGNIRFVNGIPTCFTNLTLFNKENSYDYKRKNTMNELTDISNLMRINLRICENGRGKISIKVTSF